MKRSHLLVVLIWTLLWGIFFGTLLLAVERLPNSDLSGQFHTFGLFQARELAAGRLPLWSPGSYGGIPFAADTQAAVFYPPRWLAILLTLPSGFSYYALELEGLLHIWMSGVFVYFLAFDITRNSGKAGDSNKEIKSALVKSWRLAPAQWAGLVAAVAFGIGGYLTSYPLLQLAVLESIAWLPLVLWLLRRGVYADGETAEDHSKQIPALLAAAVVLGISALAGHPQTFLHVAALAAVYFLFLTWQAHWRPLWILGLGIMVMIVAIGVALPSFLPAINFLPFTVRDQISYEFLAEGFSLLDYIQTIIPGPLSLWLPQYSGLAVLFLALVAGIGRRNWPVKRQQTETLFWILVAIFAAWLSLGDKGILFELTYRIAPNLSLFRQQERLVSIFSLGMALLGGQGLALWLGANFEDRRHWTRTTAIILAVGLLLVGFVFFMSRTTRGNNVWLVLWLRQWLILGILIVILWPLRESKNQKGSAGRMPALIILLFLDLLFPLRQAMDLQPESPQVFWPQPEFLEPLLAERDGRFDSQNLFFANVGELYGLQDVRGISPLKPKALAEFEKLDRPLRWQLLNVQYVLSPKRLEDSLTEVAPIDQSIIPGWEPEGFVYRFEEALPRAWMVYDPVIKANEEEAFDVLKSGEFEPTTQVVLTNPDISNLDGITSPTNPPQVNSVSDPGSALTVKVETETPGILVISEWALPGWQATIDGLRADLITADYALLGLLVPPGKHDINLVYKPGDVATGLFLALAALLFAAVLSWRWRPVIPTRLVNERTIVGTGKPGEDWIGGENLGKSRTLWLMAGVFLLAFGLRIFLLGSQELRGDEAFSFLFAQLPVNEVVSELIDQGDPHSPLHYLLLNVWVDLTGESELAMRIISLIPGVLLIPLLFQLGKEMIGRRFGILASMITAVSPSLIWISQDLRNQYTMALLFTTIATWLLVRITIPTSNRSRGRVLLGWGFYIIFGALSVYSHYFALFALLANGLYLWFAPGRRRYLLSWVLAGFVIFLLFLPWFAVVWTGLVNAGQLSDPDNPELTAHLVAVGRELITGSTLRGPWTRWLFLGALFFVLIGIRKLWAKKPGWVAMLAGWLGMTALIIFLVRFNRSTFNEFYISVAAPAWILLLAAGLSSWWNKRGWRGLTAAAAFLILLTASFLSLRNYFFDPDFSRTRGYRQMAAYVEEQAQAGDIFVAHFPDPALDYYLRNVPLPREMQPQSNHMSDADVEHNLAQLAETYDRVWFVPYNNSVWDAENIVPRWLDYHMLHEQQVQLDRITLQAFRPVWAADNIVTPVNSALDIGINLESVYLTLDGLPLDLDNRPLNLTGGSLLKVSLLWSTLNSLDQNYTVFVHILDDNGSLVAQHDGIPLFGTRPTYTWQPGEELLDRHELEIPENANARGRLIIGLYDTDTFERLEFAPGQDALTLAEVIVSVASEAEGQN